MSAATPLRHAARSYTRATRSLSTSSSVASASHRLRRLAKSRPHPQTPGKATTTQGKKSVLASHSKESQSSHVDLKFVSSPANTSTQGSALDNSSVGSTDNVTQRQAAVRSWRQNAKQRANVGRATVNLLKYGSACHNGKGKEAESQGSLFEKAAQAVVSERVSMLKELDALEEQLDAVQSKAFSIVQRFKSIQSKVATQKQAESGWGPDRLAPPQTASDNWTASPEDTKPAFSRSSDRSTSELTTKLLTGDDLLAESNLSRRDGRGRLLSNVTYAGPFANEQRRWKESIIGSISSPAIDVTKVPPLRNMEVAKLAHGLDRVLFNPGVYWLRDPRSGIYNFDPRIKDILDVDLFDYAALPPYITSSKDPELAKLTKQHGKKYCGSTSSMTSLLSQCYFLISGWRNPDVSGFSAPFASLPSGFSVGAKLPASILLHYKDGFYAIDADKSAAGEAENSNYVLTSLGKSMEKMLTATPEEYAQYMRINSWKLSEAEKSKPEAYHYASTGKMMMRSQLDCHDDRLPRKTFDLKTRASIGIRNDRANYVEGSGYQIRRSTGVLESFEREYFDMIRAAFLKYNFQARIGHMDGIFVAYHTTSTIFGFQYIPVEEMNERLFGSQEMAEQAFKLSLGMMESILEAATSMFPEQTLKVTVDAREKGDGPMSIYVEPADSPVTPGADSEKKGPSSHDASAVDTVKDKEGNLDVPSEDQTMPRTIVQLDVTVDRFLDGGLVQGPVDFTVLPGRKVDPMTDDEIERRLRQSLPAVKWEIDYSISPRPDLTEAKIRSNLDSVRQKQASLNSLILPNIEALNEREQFRTEELSKNPEALQRFLEERASGAAAGMPLAPGQKSAENIAGSEATSSKTLTSAPPPEDVLNAEAAASKSSRRKQAESRFIRMRNIRTMRLRELAKLGAKDAKESLKIDKQIMFQPRS